MLHEEQCVCEFEDEHCGVLLEVCLGCAAMGTRAFFCMFVCEFV